MKEVFQNIVLVGAVHDGYAQTPSMWHKADTGLYRQRWPRYPSKSEIVKCHFVPAMNKGHETQRTLFLHALEKEGRKENRPTATKANNQWWVPALLTQPQLGFKQKVRLDLVLDRKQWSQHYAKNNHLHECLLICVTHTASGEPTTHTWISSSQKQK